jgi:hypothetical protein
VTARPRLRRRASYYRSPSNPEKPQRRRQGHRPKQSLDMPATGHHRRGWETAFQWAGLFITVGGLAIYSLQTLSYEGFYQTLGLRPSDVGLSYGNILTSSFELVIIIIAWFLFLGLVLGTITVLLSGVMWLVLTRQLIWRRVQQSWLKYLIPESTSMRSMITYYAGRNLRFLFQYVLVAGLLGIVFFCSVFLPDYARETATQVKERGYPIRAQFRLGPFALLAIRADRVVVQPVTTANTPNHIDDLSGRYLLYLGEANGSAVLFDVYSDQAIRVPTSSVKIKLKNPCPNSDCVPKLFPVTCVDKEKERDGLERVRMVGGGVRDPWKMSERDAIRGIENGDWIMQRNLKTKAEPIVVSSKDGRKYLRSTSDGPQQDALLLLPECGDKPDIGEETQPIWQHRRERGASSA